MVSGGRNSNATPAQSPVVVCKLFGTHQTITDRQMPKDISAIISILFLCGLFSCGSTKNIAGTYRNKFAVANFFGTTIRLMSDSSLQYVFQGDLMYDSTTGQYHIIDNKLYIDFDKELPDTNKMYYRFNNMQLKTFVHLGDTIKYKLSYYIGHDKLFPIHIETGKKVTKARKYNKRKKYIFFGSHYYDRRYYLRRIK